ncbi:zinc finger MYND domain-containing protein [Phanerochaete sordida]|uniref:Zinc finger MYND domain-containing protein n=1 Tax=Phanerochaete sordida TaxID=48140 RepID=A0A9P3G3H3_9APHY|nr:zinc finger MYND domain-containing protein [Phanerochaete sordida]
MATENAAQGPTLDLLVIAYGSSATDPPDDSRFTGEGQRRVEIKFAPVIPVRVAGNLRRMQEWARDTVRGLMFEVKHSNRWHCEFCNKLARESHMNFLSWMHLTPPKVVIYVHLLCDTRGSVCFRRVRENEREMAALTGQPPENMPAPHVPGVVYPAAAACTKCERDSTIDKTMSRCGRCKLARYCSKECQTADWPRHKTNCKVTREVKWVWD